MTYFTSDLIYTDGQLLREHYLAVEDGVIIEVAPLRKLNPRAFRDMVAFEEALLVPGFVNAHAHSFTALLKGFADDWPNDLPPEQSLERYIETFTPEHVYAGARFAYSRMLKQGITTVCEMIPLHDRDDAFANALISAAKELGMRLVLARAMSDKLSEGLQKSSRYYETPEEALANLEALHQAFLLDPLVTVIPAIWDLRTASAKLIEQLHRWSVSHNVPFHLHVGSNRPEREWCTNVHQLSPVLYLKKLGVLSQNTVCVHSIWLEDAEIQALSDSGASVVSTPSSHLFLGEPVTRLTALVKANVPVALGTGHGARNNRSSLLEEMRLSSLLDKLTQLDPTVTTAEQMFLLATQAGAQVTGQPVGGLSVGKAADFVVLDLEDISLHPHQNLTKNLVYSLSPTAIKSVYIHAERVLDEGELPLELESDILTQLKQLTRLW